MTDEAEDGSANDRGFDRSSRSRLTRRDLGRFAGSTLLDRVGRVVCEAECLPRKELYEAWEVARRARRSFRGGRVVDLACGHGLLAHLMLLLDDTSPRALAVDTRLPESAPRLARAMTEAWPRLLGRVELRCGELCSVPVASSDLVVSVHACGSLTDDVLTHASAAKARVVVLPCCHERHACDDGGLAGWMDVSLAIDVARVARLRALGYAVDARQIPPEITPKNRLLLGTPPRP